MKTKIFTITLSALFLLFLGFPISSIAQESPKKENTTQGQNKEAKNEVGTAHYTGPHQGRYRSYNRDRRPPPRHNYSSRQRSEYRTGEYWAFKLIGSNGRPVFIKPGKYYYGRNQFQYCGRARHVSLKKGHCITFYDRYGEVVKRYCDWIPRLPQHWEYCVINRNGYEEPTEAYCFELYKEVEYYGRPVRLRAGTYHLGRGPFRGFYHPWSFKLKRGFMIIFYDRYGKEFTRYYDNCPKFPERWTRCIIRPYEPSERPDYPDPNEPFPGNEEEGGPDYPDPNEPFPGDEEERGPDYPDPDRPFPGDEEERGPDYPDPDRPFPGGENPGNGNEEGGGYEYPTIYTGDSFKGASVALSGASYGYNDLRKKGCHNIRSLRVPEGYKVVCYEQVRNGKGYGRYKVFYRDVKDFRRTGWYGRVKFMKVVKR